MCFFTFFFQSYTVFTQQQEMNDHKDSTGATKNEIELTQFPFTQHMNNHEASTNGTKNKIDMTQFPHMYCKYS